MMRNVRIAALLVVVVGVSACSKRQPPAAPAPQAPPPVQTQPQPQPTPVRDDSAEREAEMRRMREVLEQIVHFDFDESTIRADAQERLAAKVPFLRQNPGIRIRIEGHADERGSVEYNLALGMRRANAVRDYLVGFGLEAGRFDVTSYGEDRPMAQGSNESAWSLNRRAEFRVTAGM
jgi:peptidoglycan-associated lipoprotein